MKRKKLNMIKHRDVIILVRICENIKNLFVTFNPRNAHRMGFSVHLLWPFLDQPRIYVVVFAINSLNVYKTLLRKW